MIRKPNVIRVKSRIIRAVRKSWKGVTEIMLTLLICDYVIIGIHTAGQRVQDRHMKIAHQQVERAVNDGSVLKPTVSLRAKNDFSHQIARVNGSLPKKERVMTSLLIAQAGLESNWGESPLYKKANNAFGVKGKYHGKYMVYYTKENDNDGKPYVEMSRFRQYPTLVEGIRDHNMMLKKSFLKGSSDDYVSQARALQDNGYATDPHYARKLMDYVQKNHLTKFD